MWRWCALAGLVTLAVAIGFTLVPGIDACGPGGSATPLSALQDARSPADVAALFTPDCGVALAAALRRSVWLDALAFIPAYVAFVVAGLLALRTGGSATAGRIAMAGIAAMAAGAIADQVEGTHVLAILDARPGTQAMIDPLIMANALKTGLLAVGIACAGLVAIMRGGWLRIGGAVMLAAGLARLLGFVTDLGVAAPALALGWIALLVCAIAMSVRPKAAS